MSDALQSPVATGTLAKTPFAHVILYLYRQRASGTLIVSVRSDEYRVLFQRGRAIAAHAPQPMAALDQALLPLTAAADGRFAFHETDLVGSGPAVVTGMFDPVTFVVAAVRKHARREIVSELLGKYVDSPLALDPTLDLSRLSLTPEELRLTAPLLHAPTLQRTLLTQAQASGLSRDAAERLLYTLLITRAVSPEAARVSQTGQTSGAPQNSARPTRAVDPASVRVPSRPLSERLRPSGDAWRAIASRAGEIAEGRPPSGSRPAANANATRSPNPPQRAAPAQAAPRSGAPSDEAEPLQPGARPSDSQPVYKEARPVTETRVSQPQVTRGISRPLTQPISRPLTQPASVPSQAAPRNSDSRPLTPPPFRDSASAPRPTPPAPRMTPRPSQPDLDTLDSAGKFRRVEQLCQRNGYDEALPIMRILIDEDRKNAKYLGMLAHVLLGRTPADGIISKEIVDSINLALRVEPEQVFALYTKARCYKRLGKEREALHYFRRTVMSEPGHLDAAREVRLLVSRLSEKKGKR